jgi:hypothetical protein
MRAKKLGWLRHFAYLIVFVLALASTNLSMAQVDLNLQSRVNPNPIPTIDQPTISPLSPEGKLFILDPTGVVCQAASPSDPRVRKLAQGLAATRGLLTSKFNGVKRAELTDEEVMAQLRDYYYGYYERNKARIRAIPPPSGIKFCNQPQPTTVKFTFAVNPTYESNVLKTDNNSPGTSWGFAGTLSATTAGARPFDIIALSASSASTRYSAFPTKSFDAFTVQGFYQFFIDAYGCYNITWQCLDITPDTIKTHPVMPFQNMITVDTIAIGVQNQATFVPTYRKEMADLLTPQVVFNRQNINLSGSSSCVSTLQPGQYSYCYYANLAAAIGQTFSDVAALENANFAVAGTVGKRFDHTDFVLAVTGTATGKTFENVVGGRQDLLLQIGTTLTYTPNENIQASLPVTYNQNYSTLATAAWHGIVIQPTLTIIFPVVK